MKKNTTLCLVALLALTLLAMAGCSSDKYADAKSLMKDQASVAESYVSGLESAGSADDVAAVIDKYTDDMKSLIPRIKEFQKKYPELSSYSSAAGTPDEVKPEMDRLKEAMGKIQSATMNMMKYMMDPKVQQSFQRMAKELGPLGQS